VWGVISELKIELQNLGSRKVGKWSPTFVGRIGGLLVGTPFENSKPDPAGTPFGIPGPYFLGPVGPTLKVELSEVRISNASLTLRPGRGLGPFLAVVGRFS
jgi:hypothetical protein